MSHVFIINLALGTLIGFIGKDNFANFMISNRYLTPLFAAVVGLIPNCASSVILTELYLNSSITFGALLGGLLSAAGVGILVLLKENDKKASLKIIITLYLIGALCGLIIDLFLSL